MTMLLPLIENDLWCVAPHVSAPMILQNRIPQAARIDRRTTPATGQKHIAIIAIHGLVEARPTELGALLKLTSWEAVSEQITRAATNSAVTAIILDVSSVGGAYYGAIEAAAAVYNARSYKPVISVADPMAAGASYLVASAAHRIYTSPSGEVGSLGVAFQRVDESAALTKAGVKVTTIRSTDSPYKAPNPTEVMTPAEKTDLQARANRIDREIAELVAKYRDVPLTDVREKFGKGRLLDMRRARAAGMIDGPGMLDDVIARYMSGRIHISRA